MSNFDSNKIFRCVVIFVFFAFGIFMFSAVKAQETSKPEITKAKKEKVNKASKLNENTNLEQDNIRKTELKNNSEIKETEYEILKEKIISEEYKEEYKYDKEEIIGYTIDGQPINRRTLGKDEKIYYLKHNSGPANQKQGVGKEKKQPTKETTK